MTRTILVFGRSGQVARELAKVGAPAGFELAFAGRETLDLASGADPAALIADLAPAAVINAAAYTAVDRAESEPDAAFRLNRDAPAAMAAACARADAPFVHFSTDYVFDGTKPSPYVEDDPVGPTGVYGLSKAEGEAGVLAAGGAATILRTAWVFSAFGANFVKTMLRLGESRPEVAVVADQLGRPTWAEDCARAALRATQALLDRDAAASRSSRACVARKAARAQSSAQVGRPSWSATTATSGRLSPSRSMVLTKLAPNALNTQAVRRIVAAPPAASTPASPSALLSP